MYSIREKYRNNNLNSSKRNSRIIFDTEKYGLSIYGIGIRKSLKNRDKTVCVNFNAEKVSLNCLLSDTFYLKKMKKRVFSITIPIIASFLIGVNNIILSFYPCFSTKIQINKIF